MRWRICPNFEGDFGGNSIRDNLLSIYDSMRSSFIEVQANKGPKDFTRYDSAFCASLWLKFFLYSNFLDNLWVSHSVLHIWFLFCLWHRIPSTHVVEESPSAFYFHVTMHNMHWNHSGITTSANFHSQFIKSFIKKQGQIVKNQCKDICIIWYKNYLMVPIENIIIYL